MNQNNIHNIIENVKFCLDRSAKLVVLLISYDRPTYTNNPLASIKFFYDYLKTVLLFWKLENRIKLSFHPCNYYSRFSGKTRKRLLSWQHFVSARKLVLQQMWNQLLNRWGFENVESVSRREIKVHREHELLFTYLRVGKWQRNFREPSYYYEICEGGRE